LLLIFPKTVAVHFACLCLVLALILSLSRALSLLCSPLAEMELPPAESPSSEAISACMATAIAALPNAGPLSIFKLARRDNEPPASAALNSVRQL